MATKKKTVKKSAAPKKPSAERIARDLLFSWLYISGARVNDITTIPLGGDTTPVTNSILKFLSKHVTLTPDLKNSVTGAINNIQANSANYNQISGDLLHMGAFHWGGSGHHPRPREITNSFVK